MDHEMIDDVAVIGVNDDHQHTEVPRAYIVLAQDKQARAGEAEAKAIVDWMTKKVASHKRLRGGIVFVDEIPKSASGKILRRVLKARTAQDTPLGVVLMAKL